MASRLCRKYHAATGQETNAAEAAAPSSVEEHANGRGKTAGESSVTG